jgi:hypothetical protein
MPNGDKAVVTDQKLLDYLLNEQHESQSGHATLFRVLLDITPDNAELLKETLLRAAAVKDVSDTTDTPFGRKYSINFSMNGPRGRYNIMSVWIIEHGLENPRLVTAYVS